MRSNRAAVLIGLAAVAFGAACGSASSGDTNPTKQFKLTVTKAGVSASLGTVTSTPAGINCGSTCNVTVDEGTKVTLSAATAAGGAFAGFSGGCTATAATCVVTVSADTTVTATFNKARQTLRVFAWGGGQVNVSSTGTTLVPGVYQYDVGTTVTVTASASSGATFTGWSGAASGTNVTAVVTLDGDKVVGARFYDPTKTSTLPAVNTGVAKPTGLDPTNLKVINWAGYKAAFSYTFDDARSSQSWSTNYAQMKAEGIPMTFYVIPSQAGADATRLAFWKQVAADGQEIGNHTNAHCNVTDGALSNCAYGTAAANPMAEIDNANDWIQKNLNVTGVFTMATPYGDNNWAPYGQAAAFIAVRGISAGVMLPNNLAHQYALYDSFMGTDYGGKGDTAAAMNAQIDSAVAASGWTTALVHKWLPAADPVDGGDSCCQMAVSDMVTSMKYLKSLHTVWGDTVAAVGSYWIGQKLVTDAYAAATAAHSATLTWTLPPNFPPGKFVRVTIDGGVLKQKGQTLAWNANGYYEVALDAGELTLSAVPVRTIAVTRNGPGSVAAADGISCGTTCSAQFPQTMAVTLTATAASGGATFDGWSGACSGTAAVCVIPAGTVDLTVTANFSAPIPMANLNLTLAGTGAGTVTCNGAACEAAYAQGTTITLTAAPTGSSTFTSWSGDCTGTNATCELTLNADASVTATFALPSYTLTVNKAGTGSGSVTCGGAACAASYLEGTHVTLTATPDSGSAFTSWGGACTGTTATCEVTVTAATTVTATFASTASPCLLIQGTTSGAKDLAIQWDLVPPSGKTVVDFSGGAYTASFDLYIDPASALPMAHNDGNNTDYSVIQMQFPNGSWSPMYVNDYGPFTTGTWKTVTMPLTTANLAYGALLTDSAKARIVYMTLNAGASVSFCVKNLVVTDGTNKVLDFQPIEGYGYSWLYTAAGTTTSMTGVLR